MQVIQPSDISVQKIIDISTLFNNAMRSIAEQMIAETIETQLSILQDGDHEQSLTVAANQMMSPECLKSAAKDILTDRIHELLQDAIDAIDRSSIHIVPVYTTDEEGDLRIRGITDTSYIR